MTDVNLNVRKSALEKILLAREEAFNNKKLKPRCKLPDINFSAENYYEMIDWTKNTFISPPILKNITNQELIYNLSSTEVFTDWSFCEYPCHTVAVERMVKLVTEASKKVCGEENRNNFMNATLTSREIFQRFDSKKQFPSRRTV